MTENNFWPDSDPLLRNYYDQEWGFPEHDDQKLFELLTLEGMQAGLSWLTVLRKREAFVAAFHQFKIETVAKMSSTDIDALMENPGLIRSRNKLNSVITNAQAIQKVQAEFGSFDEFLWQFVDHTPILNHPKSNADIPAQTELSQTVAKTLKKRGFKFVGPVITYSFLQAAGLVNDRF
jgi:DNA-3-methyladenine glycosylase I